MKNCKHRETPREDGDETPCCAWAENDALAARLAEADRLISELLAWVPERGVGGMMRDEVRKWRAANNETEGERND